MGFAMIRKITTPFNLKTLTDAGSFTGYGAVFGNVDSDGDRIIPGAFKKSLDRHQANGTQPALLLHHDSKRPCGFYDRLVEDVHGLFVKGQLLIGTQDGSDAYQFLKAGAITGLSIGYQGVDGGSEYDPKTNVTTLKELDLWEVSLVTFPANDQARVTGVKTARDFERFLCDKGFSRNRARAICCQGFKSSARESKFEIKQIMKANIKLFNRG